MTIRLKLFITCLSLVVVPVGLLGWLSYSYTQQTVIAQIKDRLSTIAILQRDRLQANFDAGTFTPDRIERIEKGYDFLGTSGETMIIARDEKGAPVQLNARRFDPSKTPPIPLDNTMPELTAMGLSQQDQFVEDAVDYRGVHVFAASTYFKDKGWGVIVKRDREELLGPYKSFLGGPLLVGIICLILAAAFFAIFVTQKVVSPIQELTNVTQAISLGNLRATIAPEILNSKDEIGDLARAFDRTVISLKLAMSDTESKVKAANKDVRKSA